LIQILFYSTSLFLVSGGINKQRCLTLKFLRLNQASNTCSASCLPLDHFTYTWSKLTTIPDIKMHLDTIRNRA
jgi:hypothetical protein